MRTAKITFLLAPLALWYLPSLCGAQAAQPKRIVALYWYGREFPANDQSDQLLRKTFANAPGGPFDYYSEYLESNRFPGENQSRVLRDYLRQKYADRKVDALVAMSSVSLGFLLRNRHDLFPNVPIVFYATTAPTLNKDEPAVTGIVTSYRYKQTLDVALKLHPNTNQVLVISGTPEHDKRIEAWARLEFESLASKVEITYLTDLRLDELISELARVPKESIVLYIRQSQDNPGTVLLPQDFLNIISHSVKVPLYAAQLGGGSIGGYVSNVEGDMALLAQMASRIANGARPGDIPVSNSKTVPTFDWRQLRHWGIRESVLPSGSVVEFREVAVWSRYKWEIVGAFFLIAIQTSLIAALLVQRRLRQTATGALEDANDQLRRSMGEINNLSGRLISAQEDERRRISRELHDDINQEVAILGISLSAIKRDLTGTHGTRELVADVQRRLESLSDSIRHLSHELHPAVLEHFGLHAALMAHCEEFEAISEIKTELSVVLKSEIPFEVSLCLYRIAQESLRNVAKHSGSDTAWISVIQNDGDIQLTIRDVGTGFDLDEEIGSGLGLISMKERARLAGGTFDLSSSPEIGTVTRVSVPLMLRSVAASA